MMVGSPGSVARYKLPTRTSCRGSTSGTQGRLHQPTGMTTSLAPWHCRRLSGMGNSKPPTAVRKGWRCPLRTMPGPGPSSVLPAAKLAPNAAGQVV